MNGPGDIPLTHSSGTPDTRPCSLISIIPTLGMSSCRGRAEAFARRLSSKLRTLGSQTDNDAISQEDEPIINGGSANTWLTGPNDSEHTVTDLQPLRHESDSFFDFDCELESPGSPVDECEYLRLIETASNTPHNSATESGYACASAASSHSSTDGPYFDASNGLTKSLVAQTDIQQKQSQPQVPAATETPTSNSIHEANNCLNDTVNNEANNCLNDTVNNSCNCNGLYNHNADEGIDSLENNSNSAEETDRNEPQSESNGKEIAAHPGSSDASDYTSEEYSNCLLSTKDMITVQDQIIRELQRESEQILNVANDTMHASGVETITPDVEVMPDETPALASTNNTFTNAILNITANGHLSHEEETLKIEVTEIAIEIESEKERENDKDIAETETEINAKNSCNSTGIVVNECNAGPSLNATQATATTVATSEARVQDRSHLTAIDTTDDEDDCRPQRVRRCSSLKTGKTPPGTPGRKKIVRFADVLGLDLADVKTFLDEIPTIPKSAFEDLEIMDSEPPIQLGPKSDKLLMPLFQQPGGLPTFLDLVREKQVSLENAAVTDHINQTITGSVRVRNLDFHKSVHIRYTLDGWRSYADLQANYVENSCDGFSDKFTFILFGNTLQIGQRLEFAVRFQCKGQQFWDNNYGTNYCFQCLPTTAPVANPIQPIVPSHHANNMTSMLSPTASDAWCSSFY